MAHLLNNYLQQEDPPTKPIHTNRRFSFNVKDIERSKRTPIIPVGETKTPRRPYIIENSIISGEELKKRLEIKRIAEQRAEKIKKIVFAASFVVCGTAIVYHLYRRSNCSL